MLIGAHLKLVELIIARHSSGLDAAEALLRLEEHAARMACVGSVAARHDALVVPAALPRDPTDEVDRDHRHLALVLAPQVVAEARAALGCGQVQQLLTAAQMVRRTIGS